MDTVMDVSSPPDTAGLYAPMRKVPPPPAIELPEVEAVWCSIIPALLAHVVRKTAMLADSIADTGGLSHAFILTLIPLFSKRRRVVPLGLVRATVIAGGCDPRGTFGPELLELRIR